MKTQDFSKLNSDQQLKID